MYFRIPSEQELEKSGFCAEDYEQETYELWPENEKSILLFSSLSTQWRTSMNGPSGLDYNPLFYVMDRMGLSEVEHDRLFDDIRLIESEALSIINTKE